MTLHTYLPQDRLRALARGETLPEHTSGVALFADISGFTVLTEQLTKTLGTRRGAEELTHQMNAVYDALIVEIQQYGGSVISFAGDAIMCWFADGLSPTTESAVACAFAMQHAMHAFPALALKIGLATGSARRFVVGDPALQLIDALTGSTVGRAAQAEHLAQPNEILGDEATVNTLADSIQLSAWRLAADTATRFAVITSVSQVRPPLPAPPTAQTLPVETLRPWLLPAVYERHHAGQGEFLAELRPCVVLFINFAGIAYDTAPSAGNDLNEFICQAQRVIDQAGGVTLQLNIGDKGSYLYAAFGAVIAHEDDARRAVKAALSLQEKTTLPLQIGLTQGTMLIGVHGSALRRTYGVLGDDVNLAARLMQLARPGEILLSSYVQKVVTSFFTFEPRPPLAMKGKAEPLSVFVVTGERQQRAIRLQEPTYALPLVGRQTELQLIESKLTQTLAGQTQVIGLVAEAGMGKSRLVAEVIRLARKKGFAGFGGACQSDGVNTPYLAWQAVWSAFFDIDPAAPLRKQIRSLESQLTDLLPQRAEALPLVGQFLQLALPDNSFTQTLEPKERKSTLHILLEDCLKVVLSEEPLLIVIEDLHWIDALSFDLLEQLTRALSAHPICFVLAYRPPQIDRVRESTTRLETLPYFTKIELTHLDAIESAQIVRAKLEQLYPARADLAVPPALIQRLTERAQGNPFYLEELLNYLRDRGLDPRDPAALEKLELPNSLHALILSRIDQLTEHEKITLRVASIVGRLFRVAWLMGYYPTLGSSTQVKSELAKLESLDITPIDTPEPELAYLFKHIVTHEVAYESLPYATRAQLHEQLAQYLENSAPTLSATALFDVLAYHYGQSTNLAKQREYFQKAAHAANLSFANDAALNYYARLQPLLTDPAALTDLHLQWGGVLERIGQTAEAQTHYQTAITQAPVASLLVRGQFALGRLFRLRGDHAPAADWLTQARVGWAALADQTGVAQAVIEIGLNEYRMTNYEPARQALTEGLTLARTVNNKLLIALALMGLGNLCLEQGDSPAAQNFFTEGLALRREMNDKWGIAMALLNLGVLAENNADYATARKFYEESMSLRREMGDKEGIALSLLNLGYTTMSQNQTTAIELFTESLRLFREINYKLGSAVALNNLGNAAYLQGALPSARSYYVESLELCREAGNKRFSIYNLVGFAALAARLQQVERAVHLAAAAESLRASLQTTLEVVERGIYDEALRTLREQLSEVTFQAAWTAGEKMTLEEAIVYALKDD